MYVYDDIRGTNTHIYKDAYNMQISSGMMDSAGHVQCGGCCIDTITVTCSGKLNHLYRLLSVYTRN